MQGMLTDAECCILAVYCFDHVVVSCTVCRRDYEFVDVPSLGQHYCYCPSCCLDLVDEARLHILSCPEIAAANRGLIERSGEMKKKSEMLMLSSTVLAAESEALVQRALETMRRSHRPSGRPDG